MHALRSKKASPYPNIGVGVCITPANYLHIEDLFFNALDLRKLDCITLELQSYITGDNHRAYEKVLQQEFGVLTAPLAKGFVSDPKRFADLDFRLIARQIARLSDYCRASGIYLNTYPKEMSEENIRKYFTADWFSMSRAKKRCSFPWISTEINARGDVTSCHAFYDLTLGNVYQSSIGEIWRGERYMKYRQHLRKALFPVCQACCLFYNKKPRMGGLESRSMSRSKMNSFTATQRFDRREPHSITIGECRVAMPLFEEIRRRVCSPKADLNWMINVSRSSSEHSA